MKRLLVTMTAFALAAPALAANPGANSGQQQIGRDYAQASPDSSGTSGAGTNEPSDQNGSSQGNGATPNNPQQPGQSASAQAEQLMLTQQKLRSALQQAGFQQILVLGASYLIQARDSAGNIVYMAVKPSSTGPAAATTGSGNAGSDTGAGPNTNGGMNQTPNADQNEGSPSGDTNH